MGAALAAVLAFAALATADVELGVRVDERSSRIAPAGHLPPLDRSGAAVAPSAALLVDDRGLHLAAAYTPRIWTSDFEDAPSPLVNHVLSARAELRPARPWRLEGSLSGVRGTVDPLADPLQVLSPGPSQIATSRPLPYQEVHARGRARLDLDPRTALAAGAGWDMSQGLTAAARTAVPLQHGGTVDASLSRGVTERDTLLLLAAADRTLTETVPGLTVSASATASGRWRRLLTPRLEQSVQAGLSLATWSAPGERSRRDLLPVGELALTLGRGEDRLQASGAVRTSTFVDRFTGYVSAIGEVRGTVRYAATQRLSLTASGTTARRVDGVTALARADAWLHWALRPRLALETGILARRQIDRRASVPSFTELSVGAAVSWTSGRL